VVLDDGVTGRLGDEHYLMSTTSSGAATVWEWAENWLQHRTPGLAGPRHAGDHGLRQHQRCGPQVAPADRAGHRGRGPVQRAFPYMHVRTGTIAGVAASVLWRIGFTGELSYELHVPAVTGCTSGRHC